MYLLLLLLLFVSVFVVKPAVMGGDEDGRADIPPEDLNLLRGILVSSLSRENLGPVDIPSPPVPAPRRNRKVTFLDTNNLLGTTEQDEAGATPVDSKQNGRPSSAKQGGLHWFGECASPPERPRPRRKRRYHNGTSQAASSTGLWFTDDPTVEGKDGSLHVDREERLRILKEKQNEERQRKLDELKQQALAAQKFREQKEEERRRRLEELRLRDTDRRHQVEERKRQIWEAERDRREAILRKNQEREARIESKRKNERSSMVFAFGSSTPRMLEPSDAGTSYWATRRATSTTNVMTMSMSATQPGPLTRRSSERELDGDDATDSPTAAGYGIAWRKDAARRKTDLIPTMPSPRESSAGSRTPGRKSVPGRAYSMSRLDTLSAPRRPRPPPSEPQPSLGKPRVDVYRSMSVLPGSEKAEPKPKGAMKGAKSMLHLGPVPPPRATRAERLRRKAREMAQGKSPDPSPGMRSGEMTPSRPLSSMSQHSVTSNLSAASTSLRTRSATPRRPRPFSIAVTGVTTDKQNVDKNIKSPNVSGADKPPIPKVHATKKPAAPPKPDVPAKKPDKPKSAKTSGASTPKSTPLQSPVVEAGEVNNTFNITSTNSENTTATSSISSTIVEETALNVEEAANEVINTSTTSTIITEEVKIEKKKEVPQEPAQSVTEIPVIEPSPSNVPAKVTEASNVANDAILQLPEADIMSASMKGRITTEEEAKAALAERRRLAREQAEREAELERQRLEAERLAEEERIRKEEEEHRRFEEEQLRLLEEARRHEEQRLQQAIEEAKKREEEEKLRKEEELRLKIEKEESDKKAKEEAEKNRIEAEIKKKKEEEERLARKKRVEAIMARTRAKGSLSSSTTPTKDGEEEETEDKAMSSEAEENRKPSEEPAADSNKFLDSERSHTDANIGVQENNNRHNGHHNGSYNSVTQNNVTNSLLVNLGEEKVSDLHRVNDILESSGGKLNAEAPQFIPQFQDKKDPHTVNDLLS
uniref:Reticulocyte-binding protein 2 a n=1 Tax=Lygus hesperus TaxID=30085 RepID=A0A0K8T2A8_LYGHE